jgi:hypothetical protein
MPKGTLEHTYGLFEQFLERKFENPQRRVAGQRPLKIT